MSINYLNKHQSDIGTKCTTCGQVSNEVFECGCGEVFCNNCSPNSIKKPVDTIEVCCPNCKNDAYFY